MRIIIDETVHLSIEDFYRAAMHNHITLTFETVENKKNRLYDSIADLRFYHKIYPKAYMKQEWADAGWQEFICEDFHFAYESGFDASGEEVVYVHDAIHSLNYH